MSYVYCIPIDIESKEELNNALKSNGLKAEVISTALGSFFICPKLDVEDWQVPALCVEEPAEIDPHWNDAIHQAIQFLLKHHDISQPTEMAEWRAIETSLKKS